MKIIRQPGTGLSLSYGFVVFKKKEDADLAISGENGTTWHDKVIRVSVARPGKRDSQYCKILVSNLMTSITQNQLSTLFEQVRQSHKQSTPFLSFFSLFLSNLSFSLFLSLSFFLPLFLSF